MQKIGYALIGLGVFALAIWLGFEFLSDPKISTFIKISLTAVAVGVLILIGVVLKDRLRASKNDRFKGVQR